MDVEYRKLVIKAHELLAASGMLAIEELQRVEQFNGKISVNEMLGMAVRVLNDAASEAQAIADGTEDGTWPKK